MLLTVTLPAARSLIDRVSVQVTPRLNPDAGSRGKKFRNDPTMGDSDWAATLSEGTWLRKSPCAVSRPENDSPFAAVRLMPIGTVVPESGTIESMVTVVG